MTDWDEYWDSYANASNNERARMDWNRKFFARLDKQKMPKECPHCGAPKSNSGHLKHYGWYTGYECRTFIINEGQKTFKRGDECKRRELKAEIRKEVVAELVATPARDR